MDAALRLKIDPNAVPTKRKGVLNWPAPESARITQSYGGTSFALSGGYKGKWHNGVDIGGATGSVIAAAEEGVVLAAGNQDLYCRRGAYGKFVVIKHPNNLVTLYAHMSKLNATAGQRVMRGETIGYMGNTGYSSGTHLHFTVYDGTTFSMRGSRTCGPMPSGGDMDPQPYL
jgi:murein DD-endopeptidase MepM/ murein hydrolase activator NlpD